MSWKSMIEVENTGVRLPDEPHPFRVEGGIEQLGYDASKDRDLYRMTIKIHSQFAANRAEFPRATQTAERALAELLFADVRSKLYRLRHAIYNRDHMEAFKLIDEMDAATKPD